MVTQGGPQHLKGFAWFLLQSRAESEDPVGYRSGNLGKDVGREPGRAARDPPHQPRSVLLPGFRVEEGLPRTYRWLAPLFGQHQGAQKADRFDRREARQGLTLLHSVVVMSAELCSARKECRRRLGFETPRRKITFYPAATSLKRSCSAAAVFVAPSRRPSAKIGKVGLKVEGERASK